MKKLGLLLLLLVAGAGLMLLFGGEQRFFSGPAKTVNAINGASVIGSEMLRQCRQWRSDTPNGEEFGSASMTHLLDLCGPSAVLWAVRPIIVDPIQLHVGWALTHVGEEIFKTGPSLAARNSSPSIMPPVRILRVCGSLAHTGPNGVRATVPFSARVPVREHQCFSDFLVQTSTRLSMTFSQLPRAYDDLRSACAGAEAGGGIFVRRFLSAFKSENCETAKGLADHVLMEQWTDGSFVVHNEMVSLCRASGCSQQRRGISLENIS